MALSVTEQLICPPCGVVVAPPPTGGSRRVWRSRPSTGAFLLRHYEERIFDIPCPQGHSLLRTMPQLVQTIRRSPGEWADLGS